MNTTSLLVQAQTAAENCCGANAPNLSILTEDNVLSIRAEFLRNVSYNEKKSQHTDIITVLKFMLPYCQY